MYGSIKGVRRDIQAIDGSRGSRDKQVLRNEYYSSTGHYSRICATISNVVRSDNTVNVFDSSSGPKQSLPAKSQFQILCPRRMIKEDAGMQPSLPDIGDLLVLIALLFTALIVLFETLERRREGQREQRMLDAIEQEYHAFTRLGRL